MKLLQPDPAEMFEFRDDTVPAGWSVQVQAEQGSFRFKRITFVAWATDDHFYETLFDGDAKSVSIYRRWMAIL